MVYLRWVITREAGAAVTNALHLAAMAAVSPRCMGLLTTGERLESYRSLNLSRENKTRSIIAD